MTYRVPVTPRIHSVLLSRALSVSIECLGSVDITTDYFAGRSVDLKIDEEFETTAKRTTQDLCRWSLSKRGLRTNRRNIIVRTCPCKSNHKPASATWKDWKPSHQLETNIIRAFRKEQRHEFWASIFYTGAKGRLSPSGNASSLHHGLRTSDILEDSKAFDF